LFFLTGCFNDSRNNSPVIQPTVVEPIVNLFSESHCSNWSDPNIQGIVSSESAFSGVLFDRAIEIESVN
jgi:hypothetical protein